MASDAGGVLASRPWRRRDAVGCGGPFGMLGTREGNLLYFLARDYFRGEGAIVDAGSFLGRSAWCFARGLEANPRFAARPCRVIHCYDNFVVNDPLTLDAIRDNLGHHLAIGASTRHLFDQATAAVAPWLDVHEGDFHDSEWPGRPIEILLVDVAKSASLNQRLIETMFPRLLPGRAVVVQQDYHHPWLPHLHASMEVLHAYFELVEPKTDDSAAFLLTAPIPAEAIRRAALVHTLPLDSRVDLIEAAIARLPVEARSYVELARAYLLGQERGFEAMQSALETIEPPALNSGELKRWHTYSAQMAVVLDDLRSGLRRGWELLGRRDVAGALSIATAIGRDHRQFGDAQVLRAHCLRELGRLSEAAVVIEQTIARGGVNSTILVEKAWLELQQHTPARAVESARRGLELSTANRQWHAACLDVLAVALSHYGRHADAIAVGIEAIAAMPEAAWIREHHAYNLLRAGQRESAATVAREVLRMQPSSVDARHVLDSLGEHSANAADRG